jgi:hypothetical protein
MPRLPGWMPSLLRQICRGCATSAVMSAENDTKEAFESGRLICRELWPFIQELPQNVALVRDSLPEHMDAASRLLTELADEERVYQQLFVKQCQLGRLNTEVLALETPSPTARRLCDVMRTYCTSNDYRDGILAIVTAELAATAFARTALPLFESYLSLHADDYSPVEIEEGLEWLKLHTKPHTKHALWLKRMLADLEQGSSQKLPEPVEAVLKAVFAFWRCPEDDETKDLQRDLSLASHSN